MNGNAISGGIVAAAGLMLLLAAVTRDRGPILFVSIITGIAALIAAMEPELGDGVLGIERQLPTVIAIGSAVVVLVATVVPTVNRASHTIDRV